MKKHKSAISPTVRRSLRTLGADIGAARRRRRLPLQIVAERAGITRQTVSKIEKGDPTVTIGAWATVLHAMNLLDRLGEVAAPAVDLVGHDLEVERLPQRVHLPRTTSR